MQAPPRLPGATASREMQASSFHVGRSLRSARGLEASDPWAGSSPRTPACSSSSLPQGGLPVRQQCLAPGWQQAGRPAATARYGMYTSCSTSSLGVAPPPASGYGPPLQSFSRERSPAVSGRGMPLAQARALAPGGSLSFSFSGAPWGSTSNLNEETASRRGMQPIGPTVYPAGSDAMRQSSMQLRNNRSSSTPAGERQRQIFVELGSPSFHQSPSQKAHGGDEQSRPAPLASVSISAGQSPVKTAPAMMSPSPNVANTSCQDSSALLASTSSTGTTFLVAPDAEVHTRLPASQDNHLSPGLATTRSGGSDASTIAVPFFPKPVPVLNGALRVQVRDAEVQVSGRGSPDVEKQAEGSGHNEAGQNGVYQEAATDARAWAETKTVELLLRPVAQSLERLKTSIEQTTPRALIGELTPPEASPSPISQLICSHGELLTTSAGESGEAASPGSASPDLLRDLSPSAVIARHVDVDGTPGSAVREDYSIGDEILLTQALTRLEGQLGTLEAILKGLEGSSVNASDDKAV